jgi:hypothetical protein
MYQALMALLIAVTAAGCVSPPQPRLTQFIEEEYTPYAGEGTASVYGEAFPRLRNGGVMRGAGCRVHLNPVTTYSTEWYERSVIAGQVLTPVDNRVRPYHRETIADGDGKFEFEKLPAGEYYLACSITWEVPLDFYGTTIPTGGRAHTRESRAGRAKKGCAHAMKRDPHPLAEKYVKEGPSRTWKTLLHWSLGSLVIGVMSLLLLLELINRHIPRLRLPAHYRACHNVSTLVTT